ncbi:MAG: M48 family metalloprotease [Candidatus Latescibacterota bacterium]|nr:MAG: M48 family metalloprotease [Candidatus Latescibacterota bacterium]
MKTKNGRIGGLTLVVALFLMALGSCTTDYVTGKRTFSLVSESQEVALGKEADPQIVAEYGLYDDPELGAFIDQLGKRLAAKSQRPQLEYTFRVLDSPIVNAFALPGGYIYVTRGILAHFNSEDELAGVLGHEIGHVVARHSAEQISRQQLAGLGLGLGVVLWEDFRPYAELAGFGMGLLLLKYSRGQESESDMLGVEYSTKLGYDAQEMAGFFGTLKRMRGESGQGLPSFMSTHPDPGDREVRVGQLANEWQQKVAYQPLNKNRYDYLKRIDGMVHGDDPRQGYVEKNVFYHPALRFKFPVHADWQVVNSPSTVMMVSPDEKAIIQLRLGKTDSPEQEVAEFVAGGKITVRQKRNAKVHAFSAIILETVVSGDDGNLGVLSYFIKKDQKVYVFHGYTTSELYGKYSAGFASVMEGFDEVRDRAVLDKKPERLYVKKAPVNGNLGQVLRRMGMKEDKLNDLAVVNGMELRDPVRSGDWIKVVSE